MPEGDTVHRTARRLHRALSGHHLTGSDFRVPQLATTDLTGALVIETVARGKHLLTRFGSDEALTLHTHLKMEGSWRVYARGERWKRPAHQARVVLETATYQAVGFSLGIVELVPTSQEPDVVGHLGPDLLGPDWDEREALRRLRDDPTRPVIEAVLDQTRLAGIGNMYAAELCFVSGLSPRTPIADVPDLARLVRLARQMLEQNVTRASQATTGNLREPFWVYRRDKAPCRRCGTPIAVTMRGEPGRERATYWCPSCQA
ncbi:MAG TPA: DNA-formamidopyrimidine glycosylase family protein [Nocardioides sp.]|nr:DNA-formamidopyrimidine glycosylase family protein [Nocardioides sp.]